MAKNDVTKAMKHYSAAKRALMLTASYAASAAVAMELQEVKKFGDATEGLRSSMDLFIDQFDRFRAIAERGPVDAKIMSAASNAPPPPPAPEPGTVIKGI